MTPELWLANIVAHAVQAGLLTAGAACVDRWTRRAHPGLRLVLWQTVLALIVLMPLLQPWRPVTTTSEMVTTLALSSTAVTSAADPSSGINATAVVIVVLLVGVLLRLVWIATGIIRLRHAVRASEPLPNLPEAVCRAMTDVDSRADFFVADGAGPVSFGALRPTILLPRRFLSLDPGAQYLIAAHELHHVRRRDFAQGLVEELAIALVWYLPWTWWVRAQIRLAREQVVDRLVGGSQSRRRTYVHTLLAMAGHQVPALSSGAAFPQVRELRRRIDALYKEVHMSRVRLALTAALSAAIVLSLGVALVIAFPLRAAAGPGGYGSPVAVMTHGVQGDEPVRIGGDVKPPRKIKDVKPEYPPDAKEAGIQGVVILDVVVDRKGLVSHIEVTQSVPELDQAAIDAVQQWEFEPTYLKGKAVSVRMTITVNFTLK